MSNWYKIPPTLRITSREYRANITGINIVFGAVLGFVLAGTEGLPTQDFMTLLLLSATVVISILYLGSSEYRLFYAVTAAALIAGLPFAITEIMRLDPIPALQPTLAVWAIMIVLVELLPRQKSEQDNENEKEPHQ